MRKLCIRYVDCVGDREGSTLKVRRRKDLKKKCITEELQNHTIQMYHMTGLVFTRSLYAYHVWLPSAKIHKGR